MTGKRYETASIGDMQDSQGWSAIRKRFGVESFGINAWTVAGADERIIPEHDEVPSGHEELYVVISGHARFTVDGEEIDGPNGTVLYVRDPAVKRAASAREPNTTVLAVGAAPGKAYRPRSWELEDGPLFDQGEHEELKRVLVEALGKYEDDAGVLYNLACAEALLGENDEALGHLSEAVDAHPAFRESARDDPDFEPLRSDQRFQALVA
jgi:quercetin dioxygenase-like cupin family protein